MHAQLSCNRIKGSNVIQCKICGFSWIADLVDWLTRKKGLLWVYCYIKIIREVINKYYSNWYQILYNADFGVYFGCLYYTS